MLDFPGLTRVIIGVPNGSQVKNYLHLARAGTVDSSLEGV